MNVMKNFKWIFATVVLLLLSVVAIAQEVTPEPPQNWTDVLINLKGWFTSFAGVSVLTAFVAAFVNGLLKIEKGFMKQVIAWLTGIVLLIVTDLLNFGYAAEFPILLAAVHGIAVGFAANGVFDIPWLKVLLDKVSGWFH